MTAMKRLLAFAILIGLSLQSAQANPDPSRLFVPIGGGYTQASLRCFARVVVDAAHQKDVDVLVVPAAYGENPAEREANLELAQNRTSLIQSACRAVIHAPVRRCSAKLVPLLDRADALNSANGALFSNDTVAGVFFLGGDQDLAMRVLAGSPVEAAMQAASERGVVFGGSSAGDSAEARNMVAGFSPGFDRSGELEKRAVTVWWADNGNGRRGLDFGLSGILLDQHFYQRGRFGRLINMVAHSADHYRGRSLLGIGLDYGTGAQISPNRSLKDVFGASSVAIIDFKTDDAQYHWTEGFKNILSARGIVTQILGPDPQLSYSLQTRQPTLDGNPVTFRPPTKSAACAMTVRNSGELLLSGGSYGENHGRRIARFVAALKAHHVHHLAILMVGYVNASQRQQVRRNILENLRASGWKMRIDAWAANGSIDATRLGNEGSIASSGVLMIASDSTALASAIANAKLRALLDSVIRHSPVVMSDGVMTAALGKDYVTNPEPAPTDISDAAIQAFRQGAVSIRQGLGLFTAMDFVPHLYSNGLWGQLYSLSKANHSALVVGMGEKSTLVVQPFASGTSDRCTTITVAGTQPAVSLDARAATFRPATNGTFSALNVLMNVYAPGDTLR